MKEDRQEKLTLSNDLLDIKDYILAKKEISLYYHFSYCQLRRTANVLKNERRSLLRNDIIS